MASASAVGRMLPLSRLNASSAFVERVPSTSGFVVTAHSYFFLRLLATSSSKSFYGCDISSFVTHFFLLHSKPSITKVNRNPPSFASLDGGVGLVRGGCPRLHLLPHALPDLPFQFASPWQILNDVADTPLPLVQPTTGTLRELRPEPTQSSSDLRTQPPSPTQERYASASNFANLPKNSSGRFLSVSNNGCNAHRRSRTCHRAHLPHRCPLPPRAPPHRLRTRRDSRLSPGKPISCTNQLKASRKKKRASPTTTAARQYPGVCGSVDWVLQHRVSAPSSRRRSRPPSRTGTRNCAACQLPKIIS